MKAKSSSPLGLKSALTGVVVSAPTTYGIVTASTSVCTRPPHTIITPLPPVPWPYVPFVCGDASPPTITAGYYIVGFTPGMFDLSACPTTTALASTWDGNITDWSGGSLCEWLRSSHTDQRQLRHNSDPLIAINLAPASGLTHVGSDLLLQLKDDGSSALIWSGTRPDSKGLTYAGTYTQTDGCASGHPTLTVALI